MAKKVPDQDLGKPIPFDPDFKGPLKNRSCTDIICLLLFIVFIACWIAIGIWAIKNGDPNTLLVPRDSKGQRCGIDSGLEGKPYLFFFDLTKCFSPTVPFTGCDTPQVCVAKCPEVNFVNDGTDNTNKAYPAFCRTDLGRYDDTECPKWILQSESFQKRCIPSLGLIDQSTLNKISVVIHQENDFLSNLQSAISNIKLLAEAEQVAEQVIADIVASWWKILIGVGLALVACIIYILMLRWIAGIMVWVSIVGVVVALGAACYLSYDQWRHYVNLYNNESTNGYKTKRDIFLAIFIIAVIIFAIVLLVLIFLRKRIVLAIALIKEGSRAVSSVTSVLFFPILPWILQIGVVAYAICIGVYLATTGDPLYQIKDANRTCTDEQPYYTNGTECYPYVFKPTGACANAICKFSKINNEAFYPYLQAINIFGFFWLAFFVSALGQMVLAQVFAQWYWTFKKSTLPFFAITSAFYRTTRYHLGTLAFGSLIIAICRMIRVCLEYIDHKLKKYDNELVKALLCCLKCFFWCLENFLKFINKNAYIMCAIHGKNFCGSAKDAFMLLMRNILRVFVLDKVTDFLFFLSKLLVTVGVGAVAYLFFATNLVSFMDNSRLNYGVVPVIIIMIATYLIACLFFSVYSMAVDTLFLCFLEDCERNEGTPTKPYYMSKNLMKIFGKKNKLD